MRFASVPHAGENARRLINATRVSLRGRGYRVRGWAIAGAAGGRRPDVARTALFLVSDEAAWITGVLEVSTAR